MKIIIVLGLLVGFAAAKQIRKLATSFRDYNEVDITEDAERDYSNYLVKYYPQYNPNADPVHYERKANFMACRQRAIEHDPEQEGYALGLTDRCHWTAAELARSLNYMIGFKDNITDAPSHQYTERDTELARQASVDWRSTACTAIKNQGQCGSCYTFAAAAALEGAVSKKFGQKYMGDMSTQQYVDCSYNYGIDQNYVWQNNAWVLQEQINPRSSYGNGGCQGGWYTACWGYNKITKDQKSWQCYPYQSDRTNNVGRCNDAATCQYNIKVTGFVRVNDETALLNAIKTVGPVACAFDAAGVDGYTGGVANGRCSTQANHAIVVVGYGNQNGVDHWIIKNSWGTGWGEQGYFKLRRGVNACGIASNQCAYPVLA